MSMEMIENVFKDQCRQEGLGPHVVSELMAEVQSSLRSKREEAGADRVDFSKPKTNSLRELKRKQMFDSYITADHMATAKKWVDLNLHVNTQFAAEIQTNIKKRGQEIDQRIKLAQVPVYHGTRYGDSSSEDEKEAPSAPSEIKQPAAPQLTDKQIRLAKKAALKAKLSDPSYKPHH